MSDLVVNVSGVLDCVGDFVAQKPAVTLPQIVQLFLHHRFADAQGRRETPIRNIAAFRCKITAQCFKKPQSATTFAFFAQTSQRLFDHGRGPTQIEKGFRRQRLERLGRDRDLRWRLCHPVIPAYELHPATPFCRVIFLLSMAKEILERLEEKGTKPAAMFIGLLEPIGLQDHDKKILRKILRLLHGVSAATNEEKNRSPVGAAKFGQRLASLSLIVVGIRRGKNETPARRGKYARLI